MVLCKTTLKMERHIHLPSVDSTAILMVCSGATWNRKTKATLGMIRMIKLQRGLLLETSFRGKQPSC